MARKTFFNYCLKWERYASIVKKTMPKKTKQAKILAQLRRLQEAQNVNREKTQSKIALDLTKEKTTIEKEESQAIKSSPRDYSYVISDLKKTLLFVVLAVIFQISLSLIIKN